MKDVVKKGLLTLILFLGVVALFSFVADLRALAGSLDRYAAWTAAVALVLAAGNYGLRFLRWQLYLRVLGISRKPQGAADLSSSADVSLGYSLAVFLSGFAFSVTPGKIGEVAKGAFLYRTHGISLAVTAPVVIAERLTDFVGILMLCLAGVISTRYGLEVIVVAGGFLLGSVILLNFRPVAMTLLDWMAYVPLLRRAVAVMRKSYESMALLVRPDLLLVATVLSAGAWFLECWALHIVLTGFEATSSTVLKSTFIYAFSTIAGALTMLPGGLIFTEGSMILLLEKVFQLAPSRETAVAATLVIRCCTLWFAVAIGFVALAFLRRMMRAFAEKAGNLDTGPTPY
ncbi:MAG: flippase-like domain-containing protein [Myxococcales bacterium]|nr:flippase-like domain-containing protein [Myxococcales bacterium]